MKRRKLGDICSRLSSGKSIKAVEIKDSGSYPVIGGNGLRGYTEYFNFDGACAVIGRQGAACGNVHFYSGEAYMTEHAVVAVADESNDSHYLAYLLSTMNLGRLSAQSAQPGLSVKTLSKQEIDLPSLEVQRQVVRILGALDDKIEANTKLNGYLEELLLAQFKALVQTDDWSEDRAESFFEIGIGKTPPRKEPKWFSNDRKGNCVWLSIKDMAKSGAYSLDSAEYLTLDAVKQKNVRKVPEGSVLLSFKLTVGRVKIAACDMTTNEAIACFSSNDSRRLAYVFPYLLTYDYSKLGSTSSIATAVNSKTIKAMSITMPGDKELDSFYELSKPLYGQMLCIAKENAKLGLLRDTLLPKLMSGEIDVSKVDLTQLNSHLSKCSSGSCCILPAMAALPATK